MATVGSLLAEHVTLQVRSVDRLFLQAYVPKLMAAPTSPRSSAPVVRFRWGESKEELARPYFEQAEREGRFGVVLIGVAGERARV